MFDLPLPPKQVRDMRCTRCKHEVEHHELTDVGFLGDMIRWRFTCRGPVESGYSCRCSSFRMPR